MSRSIKRSILKAAAHANGVANVNRHFSTIWARYQKDRYGSDYNRITKLGQRFRHYHSDSGPVFDKQSAARTGLRMAARNAIANFFAKITRKEPAPAARSGLA
jgi:hypothetical protein